MRDEERISELCSIVSSLAELMATALPAEDKFIASLRERLIDIAPISVYARAQREPDVDATIASIRYWMQCLRDSLGVLEAQLEPKRNATDARGL